ncbi:hypothetical protein QYF36_015589 [Acer negundo]|nr:hypothetical protein QYF36_015589 [Acer negundo]
MLCVKIQNEKTSYIKSIKKIRNDHGKEFENASFENFCNSLDISHEFSALRTLQQNGVVERKNRVLQVMARVMLLINKVLRKFWTEAINTTCYIGNRVFLSVMESSNVVFDDCKPKHDDHEEDVSEIDDLLLKECSETSSGVKSNQNEEDDLPLNRVHHLDSSEPAL